MMMTHTHTHRQAESRGDLEPSDVISLVRTLRVQFVRMKIFKKVLTLESSNYNIEFRLSNCHLLITTYTFDNRSSKMILVSVFIHENCSQLLLIYIILPFYFFRIVYNSTSLRGFILCSVYVFLLVEVFLECTFRSSLASSLY
jgi:hypothetical protein